MKIYVASSWRNNYQENVVIRLRELGYEVYDFKFKDKEKSEKRGFSWSEIDPNWKNWTTGEYIKALNHPRSVEGFDNDFDALMTSDVCLMVMPCGFSAAMELGYAVGEGQYTIIYCPEIREPDLMVKMVDFISDDFNKIVEKLKHREGELLGVFRGL